MNLYKVIITKTGFIKVEAEDEEEAVDKGMFMLDFNNNSEVKAEVEVYVIEKDCYTDQQELQDEEQRYDRKYGTDS